MKGAGNSVRPSAAMAVMALLVMALLLPEGPLVSAIGSAGAATPAERLPIRSLLNLDHDDLVSGRACGIAGIATRVIRFDGLVRHLVVQDASGGIWVSPLFARERGTWAGQDDQLTELVVGTEVEIDGQIVLGGFGPLMIPDRIHCLGRADLPAAIPVEPEKFFSGNYANRRIEVPGVVQEFSWLGGDLELTVEYASRRYVAAVPPEVAPEPALTLVDAEIRLRGVGATGFNGRGECLYPRVFVDDPADVIVTLPPRSPPFEVTKLPLRSIAQPLADPLGGHRLRTEGTAIAYDGGRVLFLQDDATGIRVEMQTPMILQPGDRVEVSGFLDRSGMVAGISGAIARVVAREAAPSPRLIVPADVVEAADATSKRGQRATPGDLDGCLVRFPARLVATGSTQNGFRLTLAADRLASHISAVATGTAFNGMMPLEPGSELMVSGVLHLHRSPVYRVSYVPSVESLSLTLRSPADVSVLRSPPWWNTRRLAVTAGGLTAVLVAALAWVMLLRRQVAIETTRAAAEIRKRRDASIEFEATLRERSRLAANLHDTLLQALAGAVLQIDLCRRSLLRSRVEKAGEELDVAKRMVKHAAADLRNSVWALRTAPLASRSFNESLEAIVTHLDTARPGTISLRFDGAPFPVPKYVAGNLMLVVQEAVRNAVYHANPTTIEVRVRYDATDGRIAAMIRDDGLGFDVATCRGPAQGHFGLQGMQERIEGLGGRFSLDTAPGHGTTLHAEVVVTAHDSAVEGVTG
jgi:signal transduction histidine kinase